MIHDPSLPPAWVSNLYQLSMLLQTFCAKFMKLDPLSGWMVHFNQQLYTLP